MVRRSPATAGRRLVGDEGDTLTVQLRQLREEAV